MASPNTLRKKKEDAENGRQKQILTCPLSRRLQEVHIPRLITPAEKGRDLEPRVIDAYIIQCQAEAQEGKAALHPLCDQQEQEGGGRREEGGGRREGGGGRDGVGSRE